MRKKSWVPVIIAGAILVVMLGLALVAAGVYVAMRQVDVDRTTADTAAREFETARAPFAGRPPLLELRGGDIAIKARKDVLEREGPRKKLETLHVLTYDPDDERLVRIAIPFWLLRYKIGGMFRFSSNGETFDADRLNLRVEDLERHGPGLILDHEEPAGERVLVWVQ